VWRPRSRTARQSGASPDLERTITEPRIRRVRTSDLTAADVAAIRELLWAAFPPGEEGFTEDDWEHALGGIHVVLEIDGRFVSHASVVERELHVAGRPLQTGYVEAVATDPAHQGRGHGTIVMRDVNAHIRGRFELGALGTGLHHFYERIGWVRWRGPTSVRTRDGLVRTPDEDGFILVLRTPSSPDLDVTAPINCEWRPGDVW
jgi:aminoglycoside 2'-N-acetyltransferase I